MLVVSDSTPLNVLIRLEYVDVLGALFKRVIVPGAVEEEMSHAQTPVKVRRWLAAAPAWFEVDRTTIQIPKGEKHRGERESILLATALSADALLVDEIAAR